MKLSAIYTAAYDALCGRHPNHRPWHFQWLWIRDHHRALRHALSGLSGYVLDAGCGGMEYRSWLPEGCTYTGLDVRPPADLVVIPGRMWPIESETFDAVICTQVIEHVADMNAFVSEIARVLKPGGTLIISAPFTFNQHDWPHDYRRFTVPGLQAILARDFDAAVIGLGGVGSSSIQMFLNWAELSMSRTRTRLVIKALLMPLWILFCAVAAIIGVALDRIDATGAFYGNVFAVAHKRHGSISQMRIPEAATPP